MSDSDPTDGGGPGMARMPQTGDRVRATCVEDDLVVEGSFVVYEPQNIPARREIALVRLDSGHVAAVKPESVERVGEDDPPPIVTGPGGEYRREHWPKVPRRAPWVAVRDWLRRLTAS